MRRFIIPTISTIVFSVLLSWYFLGADLLPAPATAHAELIDSLLDALFVAASITLSLVMSFMIYSLFAFRRQTGDVTDADPNFGNPRIELAWTIIPLIIVLAFGTLGALALLEIRGDAQEPDVRVNVTGVQWSWAFEYPDLDFTTTELVVPVDELVDFQITSTDVIHSFWVPEWRVKMDANPGLLNNLRITPAETGEFQVHCSELCGTAHAYMTAPVRVVERAEFDQWVQAQQEAAQVGGAEGGQRIAEVAGCLGCHSTDGSPLIGPTFQGLAGREVQISDGSTVTADDEYIHRSIVDPSAQLVQGFPDVMPKNFAETLSEDEIGQVIEFIKTLQ